MSKRFLAVLVTLTIVGYACPSLAVPRVQSYIWRSSYLSDGLPDQGTWVTSNDNFFVTTAAYWKEFDISDLYNYDSRPAYDYIDCYLRVGALHFDHGVIHEPGWGSMRSAFVSVSGYSSVLFYATGLDSYRKSYINPRNHDARYCATPEPGTLSLLGLGLLGAVPLIRRKRKR